MHVTAAPYLRSDTGAMSSQQCTLLLLLTYCLPHEHYVTVEQSRECEEVLVSFYGDATVHHQSKEQRAAVENVLCSNCDMLAVLPTGCGKSFALSIVRIATLKSVVIVPTVSLQADLLRRVETHHITATNDPSTGLGLGMGLDVSCMEEVMCLNCPKLM